MNKQKKEALLAAVIILENTDKTSSVRHLKEAFPKYFKEDKPLDRWYINRKHTENLVFIGSNIFYGLNIRSEWGFFNYYIPLDDRYRLATQEEILERLSNYAKSEGYKKGVTVDRSIIFPLIVGFETLLDSSFQFDNNNLYCGGYCIMKDGVWAKIVEQPLTLEDRLTRIEKELGI